MVIERRPGYFWGELECREYARRRVRSANRRRRWKSQRRFLIVGLVLLGLSFAANVARSASPRAHISVRPEQAAPAVRIVTIAAGETLWTVAQRYAQPGISTQERVRQVAESNGGLPGPLVPGQRIVIPL